MLNLETGKEVNEFQTIVGKKPFGYWWFTPDMHRLLRLDYLGKKLVVTDVATGTDLRTIPFGDDQDTGSNAAVTPNGRRVATVHRDHTLRVWDVVSGKEIARYPFSGSTGARISISNDGRYAAAGVRAGAVYLWRLPD